MRLSLSPCRSVCRLVIAAAAVASACGSESAADDDAGNSPACIMARAYPHTDGMAIAVADSGDIFVTGSFEDTAELASTSLTSAGGTDVFVGRHGKDQETFVWAVGGGGASDDVGRALALDAAGDVILAASYNADSFAFDGIDVGGAGWRDTLLVKISGANGEVDWLRPIGGEYDDIVNTVGVNVAGDLVVSGCFEGDVDFGGTSLISDDSPDLFVAEYSGFDGSLRWAKRIDFEPAGSACGVMHAIAPNGDIVLVGGGMDAIDIDGVSSQGSADGFVATLTPEGAPRWLARIGGWGDVRVSGVDVDGDGMVSIVLTTTGELQWNDDGVSDGTSLVNGFVVRVNQLGNPAWISRLRGTNNLKVAAVRNYSGLIWVAGSFTDSVDFGGERLVRSGAGNGFIAAYSPSGGRLEWVTSPGTATVTALGASLDSLGVTGSTSPVFFGYGTAGGGLVARLEY